MWPGQVPAVIAAPKLLPLAAGEVLGVALRMARSRASNRKSKKLNRLEQPRDATRPMAGVSSDKAAFDRRREASRGASGDRTRQAREVVCGFTSVRLHGRTARR